MTNYTDIMCQTTPAVPPEEYTIVSPGFSAACAFCVAYMILLLIWELVIVLRMWYGPYELNKLHFKPLKWAAITLTWTLLF